MSLPEGGKSRSEAVEGTIGGVGLSAGTVGPTEEGGQQMAPLVTQELDKEGVGQADQGQELIPRFPAPHSDAF